MCGIWASIGLPWLPRSLELVAHRGPDGTGFRTFEAGVGPVVLGHRRLAIVDPLARSDQPFADPARDAWISFNGEILNHLEIREELRQGGHRFSTEGDTEVLLATFGRGGTDALEALRGFFAFVVVDRERGELWAARDRFGIKPLYLWRSGDRLALASEIKQFLAIPQFRARLDRQALRDYLTFGVFDHGAGTFFRDVEQMTPGSALRVRLDRPLQAEQIRWAAPPAASVPRLDGTPPEPRLRALLARAVDLNLRSDASVAVALSGGLDSSAVAGLAAAAGPSPRAARVVAGVGVMFDDRELAEEHHARAVAERHGLAWHRTTLDAGELQALFEQVIWHFDEPVVRASMLAQFHLFSAIARTGARVALTGQAGDELLGGYAFSIPVTLLALARCQGLATAIAEFRRSGVAWRDLCRGVLTAAAPQALIAQAFARLDGSGFRHRPWLASLFDPVLARSRSVRIPGGQPQAGIHGLDGRLSHCLLVAANLPMLLHYEDRASMAAGVEARPVLLDPEVVNACLSAGPQARLRDGHTKAALRAAVADLLPASVCARRDKLGFPVPQLAWEQSPFGGWLKQRALEATEAAPGALSEVLDLDQVRSNLTGGGRPGPLWALASLGVWCKQFNVSD